MTRHRAAAWAAAWVVCLVVVGAAAERSAALFALRFRIQRNPEFMPSTLVVPASERERGLPTLSLYVPPEDLYDRKTGILANKQRHGRAWERKGSVSYLDKGRVLYASTTGVRVHGGGSRVTAPRQGYRLYLRREYGASTVPPGLLFGPPHEHPVSVLVVHNDLRTRGEGVPWALVNPLAFDLAAAVGGITTPSRPVRFLLNGEFQGVFLVYEHFTPEHYFGAHGARHVRLESQEFTALYDQLHSLTPFTSDRVGDLVDLDNLVRWFIATAFCATRDPFQGPGQFRDPSRTRAQWFWVNWDMDGSFANVNEDPFVQLLLPPGVEHRGRRPDEVRPYILTRLLSEDPAFKARFEDTWVDAMNFALTAAFVHERLDHYRKVAVTYGVQSLDYLPRVEAFLRDRPGRLRNMAEQYLRRPTVAVRVESERPVTLNRHDIGTAFDGYFFEGMTLSLDVPKAAGGRFEYWRVNGQPQPRRQAAVSLTAEQDLVVQAIWR